MDKIHFRAPPRQSQARRLLRSVSPMARSRQRAPHVTSSDSARWRWPGDCSISERDPEESARGERQHVAPVTPARERRPDEAKGDTTMTTQTSFDKPVHRIAIVGTGVIGASWSAFYLAHGFDVVATDPAPNAETQLRHYVDEAWPLLTNVGLSEGGSRDRLTFTRSMQDALSAADFVQENGPERPDFKMKLFADMDAATPVDSIIASSSSGITPSVMQSECKHPERVLVGHPFNPPHIIPLVEVVGGARTSPEAVRRALAF